MNPAVDQVELLVCYIPTVDVAPLKNGCQLL